MTFAIFYRFADSYTTKMKERGNNIINNRNETNQLPDRVHPITDRFCLENVQLDQNIYCAFLHLSLPEVLIRLVYLNRTLEVKPTKNIDIPIQR
jgi:hypothetical protein